MNKKWLTTDPSWDEVVNFWTVAWRQLVFAVEISMLLMWCHGVRLVTRLRRGFRKANPMRLWWRVFGASERISTELNLGPSSQWEIQLSGLSQGIGVSVIGGGLSIGTLQGKLASALTGSSLYYPLSTQQQFYEKGLSQISSPETFQDLSNYQTDVSLYTNLYDNSFFVPTEKEYGKLVQNYYAQMGSQWISKLEEVNSSVWDSPPDPTTPSAFPPTPTND